MVHTERWRDVSGTTPSQQKSTHKRHLNLSHGTAVKVLGKVEGKSARIHDMVVLDI